MSKYMLHAAPALRSLTVRGFLPFGKRPPPATFLLDASPDALAAKRSGNQSGSETVIPEVTALIDAGDGFPMGPMGKLLGTLVLAPAGLGWLGCRDRAARPRA